MEHDDYGCRHSACDCRSSQRALMGLAPSLFTPFQQDSGLLPAVFLTRDYQHITQDKLFKAVLKSLEEIPYFKIWKIDENSKSIDMTTYSTNLTRQRHGSGRREQVIVKVLKANDYDSSATLE